MTIFRYAQLNEANTCIADSTLNDEVLAPNMIPLAPEEPSRVGMQYDNGNWHAVADEPSQPDDEPPRIITEYAFRQRFTQAEKLAIYTAAKSHVEIEIWLDDLRSAEHVDLGHQPTIEGVEALEHPFELIGPGRADEILGRTTEEE